MYDDKQVKQLITKYRQYRRLQAKRVEQLQKAENKPGKENIKPMKALLANIGGLLKEIDNLVDEMQPLNVKPKKEAAKVDPAKLVN